MLDRLNKHICTPDILIVSFPAQPLDQQATRVHVPGVWTVWAWLPVMHMSICCS